MNKFPRLFLHGLLSVFLMASAGSSVSAQEVRIGAVNLDSIVRDSALAKSLTAKLEQDFSPREKEIQALGVQLKSSSEKFEREAPTLPEAQRITRQRQLVEQDREFQRKQREFQEDLALRKSEALQQVVDRANRALKKVAEAEKYDLIIQDAAYINPKLDITAKVIDALNSAK